MKIIYGITCNRDKRERLVLLGGIPMKRYYQMGVYAYVYDRAYMASSSVWKCLVISWRLIFCAAVIKPLRDKSKH